MRKPDFEQLLKVLRCEKPDRPTLFEFFLNSDIYEEVAGDELPDRDDPHRYAKLMMLSYARLGYDYVTLIGSQFSFAQENREKSQTISMSHGGVITDRESYDKYKWNEPENFDYNQLTAVSGIMPDGMKIIGHGAGGVLENLVSLMGYENLCFAIYEDPDLVKEIVDNIGSRLLKHYSILLEHECIGAIIANDDWGFNTQTMLTPDDMRKYIFPWHKKIVDLAHSKNVPAILHSCGYYTDICDDIIDGIGFDGKHSYEDNIVPVERAYEELKGRIAVLGGIDLDFVCRSTPEDITKRCMAMLERSAESGGYALGTGNSVPSYVSKDNYYAMIRCVI